MECPNCSGQIEAGAGNCRHCGHELAVKVLSRQERDNFNGITIEEKGDSDNRRQYADSGERPRVKQVNIAFDSSSWTGKLIVAAILGLLIFFFLPLMMFIVLAAGAVVGVFWLLRMFRR